MKKLLLLAISFFIATNCWAATTWEGDESAVWTTVGNWTDGVPDSADDVTFNNAAACTLAASTTVNSINFTGYTGTLTHNAFVTLTIDGQDGGGDSLIMGAGMTYTITAVTSRIIFTGAGTSDITCAGITLPNVTFNNAGDTFSILDELKIGGTSTTALYLQAGTFTHNNQAVTLNGTTPTINGAFSFYTLNRTGTAVKTDTLSLASDIIVTNTLNLDGNSGINRLLVTSNTLGTPRTLTLTGATVTGCTNVDFRDITFTSTGAMDFTNSGANWIGDCGGNTSAGGGTATFTTADDWYFYQTTNSGTHNFSDYTQWYEVSGGTTQMVSTRCVLPQDTAYFDASSINGTGTITVDQDMPRICKTLDFTGVDAMNFHMNNISQTLYGGLILVDNVTVTYSSSYSLTFGGRASYNFSPNDDLIGTAISINMIPPGYLTLTNNLVKSAGFNLNNGTFDADTYNITGGTFTSSGSSARTLLMGSGTWTINYATAQNIWNMGTTQPPTGLTNPTTMGETSVINFGVTTGTTAQDFLGGGCVYNNVTIVTGSTGVATIQGSNTFNTLTINAPKTVKFTSGTTQIVNSFVATGDAVNTIALQAVTTDVIATISDANGGTNENDYLNVNDIVATQVNTFYYGANGSADAESTNWLATSGVNTSNFFLLF